MFGDLGREFFEPGKNAGHQWSTNWHELKENLLKLCVHLQTTLFSLFLIFLNETSCFCFKVNQKTTQVQLSPVRRGMRVFRKIKMFHASLSSSERLLLKVNS